MNYINAHPFEPLTVEILTGRVNLSSSAFSRRFRELTGRSPYQFVKDTRLERARELLLERRLGVGDIAEGTIDCPCHGSKFNLDGTVAKGPASRPLEPKRIAVEGTSIVRT